MIDLTEQYLEPVGRQSGIGDYLLPLAGAAMSGGSRHCLRYLAFDCVDIFLTKAVTYWTLSKGLSDQLNLRISEFIRNELPVDASAGTRLISPAERSRIVGPSEAKAMRSLAQLLRHKNRRSVEDAFGWLSL